MSGFRRTTHFVVPVLLLLAGVRTATAQSDRDSVLQTVHRFLDALASRDTAMLNSAFTPEGRFLVLGVAGSAITMRGATNAELIASIAGSPAKLLERIWEPQVLIDGPLAVVWAPYDFYRDGSFSHCGTDAFLLARTPDGWRITGGSYTVVRTGCPPSPLGAPPPPIQ